jgi:hypothetical protein
MGGAELPEEPVNTELVGDNEENVFDGKGAYKVVNPQLLCLGKSYSDWTATWFNWFLCADADRRNSGPVVFLRSRGLPNSITGANTAEIPKQMAFESNAFPDSDIGDVDYRAIYVNDPNVRIGSDRLQIFQDQLVFVPIIVAYELASTELRKDWGWLQDFTGLTIDYGDDPPDTDQLTINNQRIILGGLGMREFRIATPIFTAVVPETQYGRSIKDFLEDSPIAPGNYPALVEGYFVMLKFEPGSYWVHSWASAPRERSGPYFSELLYQIEVYERPVRDLHKGIATQGLKPGAKGIARRPARNERVLNKTLFEKEKTGELTKPEINRFRKFLS